MGYPRDELKKLGDDVVIEALSPLSWYAIKNRIEQLDHCATGGVSADATLIASLALLACKRNQTK